MSGNQDVDEARATVIRLAEAFRDVSIEGLLRDEAARGDRLVVDTAGLLIDFTRQRLPLAALDALLTLAHATGMPARRDAMYDGEAVNFTEQRPALHVALRRPPPHDAEGDAIAADVVHTLAQMAAFCDAVRDGHWLGATGHAIRDVVHVGIGGSHLGPQLACEALAHFADTRLQCRFLSNVDPDAFERATAGLDPATTLAIIASKSWHTTETARNALALRRWYAAAGIAGDALQRHFVGISSNVDAAVGFGLAPSSVFPMRDWVGGRYSLWSAIGLPVMLVIGPANFRAMLDGAHAMDRHFREAPLERNAPVLMALVSLWNRLALDGGTEVVVPYSDALRSLVAYLQQLQMESNGKRVDRHGRPVAWSTVPAVWGSTGTDAQHSFFQALHQGTAVHPVDFVIVVPERPDDEERGIGLLANALAQVEALVRGRDDGQPSPVDAQSAPAAAQAAPAAAQEAPAAAIEPGASPSGAQHRSWLAAHRSTPGNRPCTVLLLERLDPARFGALLALYEHKTATLGWLWDIDSFDQWGVELGKKLAAEIEPLLDPAAEPAWPQDAQPSVVPLITRIRALLADRAGLPADRHAAPAVGRNGRPDPDHA